MNHELKELKDELDDTWETTLRLKWADLLDKCGEDFSDIVVQYATEEQLDEVVSISYGGWDSNVYNSTSVNDPNYLILGKSENRIYFATECEGSIEVVSFPADPAKINEFPILEIT